MQSPSIYDKDRKKTSQGIEVYIERARMLTALKRQSCHVVNVHILLKKFPKSKCFIPQRVVSKITCMQWFLYKSVGDQVFDH